MFYYQKILRSDDRIRDVYKLRYKVYCDEWGFEKPEDHPEGIEVDCYDPHSSHFAVIRRDNDQIIGTTRLICFSERGFPMENHTCIEAGTFDGINRCHVGEVSRLAVSKDYRRRYTDKVMFEFKEYNEEYEKRVTAERRKVDQEIVLNLYTCIYRECLEREMTHLIAVMADGLHLLLKRIGITFVKIGPAVDYHGPRTPYICDIENTIQHLQKKNPEIYSRLVCA